MRTEPQGRQLLSWSGTMFEYLMLWCSPTAMRIRSWISRAGTLSKVRSCSARRRAYPGDCRNPPTVQSMPVRRINIALSCAGTRAEPGCRQSSRSVALLRHACACDRSARRRRKSEKTGIRRSPRPMGFYESIDYSIIPLARAKAASIYAYMAHHQGMTMGALNNLPHGDILRRRSTPISRSRH